MKEKLHANAIPVHCPIGAEGEFKGMVDLVRMKAYYFHDETLGADWEETEVPADLLEKCREMRGELLEELATVDETNEGFMTKVLEDPDSLSAEEINAIIRKGVIANKFNPVLCGKSTLMRQILKKHYEDEIYFVDFEDERFVNFTTQDFNSLYEILIELYGLKFVFFFDEIQNIEGWELFVRRIHREKNKVFITGSNASLLSSELSTRLTGRHIVVELLPFSFREYLKYHLITYNEKSFLITKEKAILKRCFNEFLENGGMPEYLEHKNPLVLQNVYENILYKDVIVRYEVKEVKAIRELTLDLLSNIGAPLSYTKMKNNLNLGSVNTVKNYIHYLENAYLIFTLDRFSFSVSQQTLLQKKVYAIDTGLVQQIAFHFSKKQGRYLENIVYLELRRRYKELFYYKTEDNLEVDFLVREGTKIVRGKSDPDSG